MILLLLSGTANVKEWGDGHDLGTRGNTPSLSLLCAPTDWSVTGVDNCDAN